MDKCDSINGYSAPLFSEITSAMYTASLNVPTINYIYGLGGCDVRESDIEEVYTNLAKIAKNKKIDKKLDKFLKNRKKENKFISILNKINIINYKKDGIKKQRLEFLKKYLDLYQDIECVLVVVHLLLYVVYLVH